MSGINSWIVNKKCNNSQISRRDFLTDLIEDLFELVHAKENNSIPVSPSTPKTPLQNKKRSSNTPISSKKVNVDLRKKCQVRLCKDIKTHVTCSFSTKPTCGVSLHEQKVVAV